MAERQSRSRLQRKESAMFKEPNLSKALKHWRQVADCGLFAAIAQSAERSRAFAAHAAVAARSR